ncbi:cyclic nucleotide-binding domain-containing protein [Actinomadura yumaensis]|uniref:cyclic nucleotide-binding domain-containing protein n=1 Tax=Actinomadura yumaensis TaxID=111807 RepID=UPI00361B052C
MNVDEYDYLFEDSKTLLTGPELEFFERYGQALHREAGHRFIEQDEKTDFMLLIRKGHVIVWNPALRRIQAIRGEGEVVGETAAIAGMPRSATIEALDSVEVLRLSGRRYRQFLGEHPGRRSRCCGRCTSGCPRPTSRRPTRRSWPPSSGSRRRSSG